MAKHYIVSTLTNDHKYTNWKPLVEGSRVRQVDTEVLIKGGANLANSNLHTPKGVVTEVSDLELEYLERNSVFQKHVQQGLIAVHKSKVDGDKAAASMTKKDGSAPYTPGSFANSEAKPLEAGLSMKSTVG